MFSIFLYLYLLISYGYTYQALSTGSDLLDLKNTKREILLSLCVLIVCMFYFPLDFGNKFYKILNQILNR